MATLTMVATSTLSLTTIVFPYLTQVIGTTQEITPLGTYSVTDSNLAVACADAVFRSAFSAGSITLTINGLSIANNNAVGNGILDGLADGSIVSSF